MIVHESYNGLQLLSHKTRLCQKLRVLALVHHKDHMCEQLVAYPRIATA